MRKIDAIFGFIIAITAVIAIGVGCANAEEPVETTQEPTTAATIGETIPDETEPTATEVPVTEATEPTVTEPTVTEPPVILYDVPLDEELQRHIIAYCEFRQIDPAIVFAVASVESRFDPNAVGDGGRSLGMMQIQPRWHSERMEKLGVSNLFDPFQNAMVGIDYLCGLLGYYSGDTAKALVAYNQGQYKGTITDYANSVLYIAQQLRGSVYLQGETK